MCFGEFQQRAEPEVGGAPFGQMGLVMHGNSHAGHAGGFSGDDAIKGVFEGQALDRADGKRFGTVHIYLGMRLAIGKMFGGGDGLEFVLDAQLFDDYIYKRKG